MKHQFPNRFTIFALNTSFMKNYLFCLFAVSCMIVSSQSTLHQNYSYPTGFLNGFEKVYPAVYGNTLFYAYTDNSIAPDMAPCVQKNNLDGVPVWKKAYKGLGEALQLVPFNGKLLLIGQTTIGTGTSSVAHVFIASIDTSSGNMTYLSEHELPGFYSVSIEAAKIMSNGDLVISGSAFMLSVSCCRGYLARFNSSNGNLIYQRLITIDSQLESPIKSIEEISNASMLISGSYGSSNSFVAKISNIASPSITDVKSYSYPPDKISKLSANVFLLHTGAAFLKIDTMLNAASIMPNWSTLSFGGISAYYNGKIYAVDFSKKLAVLDTAGAILNVITSHSYAVTGNNAFTTGYFTFNNSNMYMTYDFGSTGGPFSLFKTDLDGALGACAISQTVSVSSFANTSSSFSHSISVLTGTLGTTTPTMVNGAVSNTVYCLNNVGVKNSTNKTSDIRLFYSQDGPVVTGNTNLEKIEVMDISGKIVYESAVNNTSFIIPPFAGVNGIYLLKIYSSNFGFRCLKLVK